MQKVKNSGESSLPTWSQFLEQIKKPKLCWWRDSEEYSRQMEWELSSLRRQAIELAIKDGYHIVDKHEPAGVELEKPRDLVTVAAGARRINCSRETLYYAIRTLKVKARRDDNFPLVTLVSIEEIIEWARFRKIGRKKND